MRHPVPSIHKPLLAAALLAMSCGVTNAAVIYALAGPVTVNETWNYAPPGLSLSRGATATGTLYFQYTVTNPASNSTTEFYYAGLSFYDGGNEHLGIGNGWDPYAYSAFNTSVGNKDLNSSNPENPGNNQYYQLVRSSDTTTIAFRVDFNSGADDNVTVWLNPDFGLSEAAQSAALTTSFTANADFNTIYLREGGGGGGWTYTNLRIAENPTDSGFFVPEPSAALLGAIGLVVLLRRRR